MARPTGRVTGTRRRLRRLKEGERKEEGDGRGKLNDSKGKERKRKIKKLRKI
jgi:hypothetical protein